MKLADISPLAFYAMQNTRVRALRVGVPYGPAQKRIGVLVQYPDGRERILRAQDLDRPWRWPHDPDAGFDDGPGGQQTQYDQPEETA